MPVILPRPSPPGVVLRPSPPPSGALIINRDINVRTPMALGGTTVLYGYVQTNLCPAVRAAVIAMFANMRYYQRTDWDWYNNDNGCRVSDAAHNPYPFVALN